MSKLHDKRVIRTKKSFKHALISLLKESNFENITITAIVNEAGYNRGTFYLHYQCKEDLLDEVVKAMLNNLAEAFREPYINMNKNTKINIVGLSTIGIFDHFIRNKEFYEVILSSNVPVNYHQKMIRLMEKHFKEEIDFTANKSETDIDIELFYQYRVHGIIGLILEWIRNDFQHSPCYMAEQIVKIATFHTKKIYIKW